MKKLTTLLLATLFSLALTAQNDPRIARSKTPLAEVPLVLMPHLDNAALLAAEMERRGPGIPPKFAEAMEVDISPDTHGQWSQLPNGNALWRLRIRSEGARSLNLGFTKYFMPTRGTLILYSPDLQTIMGPFTPADNEEHEQLWTPILPGEELVVEVQVPAFLKSSLQLELKYVNHDFIGFAEVASGSCNLDVICGAADNWAIVDQYRDIIQSVAVMQYQGTLNCTGFLVNNARQDCTPYFMTANHCGVTAGVAPTLVNYWNFQNSTCRQPNTPASGGNGDGQLNDFNTGSVLKATFANSDFTLLELDDPVSPTANAYFAGWSAEDFAPTDTVIGIHHPSTDEKRISFEFQPTFIADYNSTTPNPDGTHLTVPDWDIGTTEGGSSGSPLFNREKQVVGQLHGGLAFCGNNLQDSYGWFHISWEGGGTPGTRLKDWLDPDNTGITTLDGRAAVQCSYFVEGSPSSIAVCAPTDVVYTVNVSANFTADVNLSVANLPAGLTATFGANPVMPGGTTTLTISNTSLLPDGNYNFMLNGTDGTESNSSSLQFFVAAQPPAPATLTAPADGAGGIGLTPIYQWALAPSTVYTIEIATDAAFGNIVETATNLTTGSYTATVPLLSTTTYYWRVRGDNVCGQGAWPSVPNSFTTGSVSCAPVASANVPVTISQNGGTSVTSTLTVTNGGYVDDINVTNLYLQHTWVGDLRVELTSPSGTTIRLFENPGGGDCEEDNIQVSFDDEATATNAAFDQSCSATAPAIIGSFQPLEPLSGFNGEPSLGTWTLTVFDDADQDGGALVSWGLDLCSTIPNDFSVAPSSSVLNGCVGAAADFALQLGGAFVAANGVTLSATGLPSGTTATFTPNPAPPGAQVAVSLSGASTAGSYDLEVTATDGLGNNGTASIQWIVSSGAATPTTIAPTPDATGISTSPVFAWSIAGDSYQLAVATDPNMTNIVFQGTSTQPSLVANGLEPCTVYYWTVTASNQCGSSQPTAPQSFTTLEDLVFNVQQNSISSCPTGNASISLSVGQCFESSGLTLSAAGLPAGAAISFAQNPALPGSNQSVAITLDNVASGSYVITIMGIGELHNVTETFTLNVSALAAAPTLVAPANAAINVNVVPAFDWNTVAGATSYFIEVATDANFNNIVFFNTTAQSQYAPSAPLNVNTTYYWHVFANNSCGSGAQPATFSFTTWPVNAVHEINGLTVSVSPNPTSGLVNAVFSKATDENMDATLHTVNGILVKNQLVPIGSQSVSFDLSAMPSGVYLLRLRSASGVLTKKIVVEK